jgi:hypothetical protein
LIRFGPLQKSRRFAHDLMRPLTGQFAKGRVDINDWIALAGFGDDDGIK